MLTHRQLGLLPSDTMQNPPTLVHCMAIDTWDDFSPDKHYLPMTDESKKQDDHAEELPEVEFEKLTYTDDDFDSNCYDDWIGEGLQNIVNKFSSSFHAISIKKRGSRCSNHPMFYWAL